MRIWLYLQRDIKLYLSKKEKRKKKENSFCLPLINVRLSSPEQSCWVYTNEQVEWIPDESQAG